MIKVGKLQVNREVKPRTFLILTIYSFILFLMFFCYTINNFIKIKDYIQVYGLIKETGTSFAVRDNESTYKYVILSYSYNDNEYTTEQTVSRLFSNKKVGDTMKIYINPKNPSEVIDNYMTKLSIILSLFSFSFHICLYIAMLKKKNYYLIPNFLIHNLLL